ncbi:MAG: transglutaminase family protein [Pseudomonadales bacterium]|jgi:transglutaminase-like putative cysteine protease|nr:transglutaminase family protein [Pseudomonadales bacterium]
MPTRLRIFHETCYEYNQPVMLGNHKLLVRPRDGHDIRIEASKLSMDPGGLISWHRDELDNSVALVTFSNVETTRLTITSEVTVAHYLSERTYIPIEPHVANYPFEYNQHERDLLSAYFSVSEQTAPVEEWIISHTSNNNDTLSLLQQLSNAIFRDFTYRVRHEEGVQSPAETLALRMGSCRDFAWLFVISARRLGLAARFVSGYFHTEGTSLADGSTHAWAEIYLPGSGWTGFDPTANRIVGENHVPVSIAINPVDIPPVSGQFTGPSNVARTLSVRVNVNQV